MKYFIFLILSILVISCSYNKSSPNTSLPEPKQSGKNKKYVQINFKVAVHNPTIRIDSYTLITDDIQRDSSDAQAIIRAKPILPLAMQKHDASLFDSTLSKDFISQSTDEFFDREAYIQNRVNGRWMISDVQYENIVLELFGNIAVLTYKNTVKEKMKLGNKRHIIGNGLTFG